MIIYSNIYITGSLFNEKEFHDWMLKVGFVSLKQLTTENYQYEKRMRYLLRKSLEKEEKAKNEADRIAQEKAEKKKIEEELRKLKKSYNSATSITLSLGVLSLVTVHFL